MKEVECRLIARGNGRKFEFAIKQTMSPDTARLLKCVRKIVLHGHYCTLTIELENPAYYASDDLLIMEAKLTQVADDQGKISNWKSYKELIFAALEGHGWQKCFS